MAAPSHGHSLVPSPVLSATPSHAPSHAPSITLLPSGLPQLEVSPNAAGGQEEEGYDSDMEERAMGFLLDTEEDGPMTIERDDSEI